MEQSEHAIEIGIKHVLEFIVNLKHINDGAIGVEFWFDWTALLFFIVIYFFCKSVYKMYKRM